jgi:site-specific recombinase XerD
MQFLSNKVNRKNLSSVTIQRFMDEYLAYCKANKRPRTLQLDAMNIKRLTAFCDNLDISSLADITSKHIEDYKTQRAQTLKPASVNRELDSIRAMFNKAIDWEYIIKSPAKYIKPLKKPLKQPRFLDKEEIRRLIETTPNPLKTAFMIALYTQGLGYRKYSICNGLTLIL